MLPQAKTLQVQALGRKTGKQNDIKYSSDAYREPTDLS